MSYLPVKFPEKISASMSEENRFVKQVVVAQPRSITKVNRIPWALVLALVLTGLWAAFVFATYAHAAETLPAVSPPTDWTGVLVVCGFGLVIAAALVIGYAIHARRTPGTQLGEETIERLAIRVGEMMKPTHTITFNVPPAKPPPQFPPNW